MHPQESDPAEFLFDIESVPTSEIPPIFRKADAPVWTENKAQLIQRYLRYFVFITKHGTYIDAFAAPQCPQHANVSCAAKLVLESEPTWFRTFALFDIDRQGVAYLEELAGKARAEGREVHVIEGDTNITLPRFLADHPVPPTEAAFCLFDQRTFECSWKTVETVARHKAGGNKIELFYFLAELWLTRSISALRDEDRDATLTRWWGNGDWRVLADKPMLERGRFFADRFRHELGYHYAYPFPIYEREGEGPGHTMFWMIHASDHKEAPKLMMRAYRFVVAPLEPIDQLEIEFARESPQ